MLAIGDTDEDGRASMFERMTNRARRAIVLAQEEARVFSHNYIGTEHLPLGLIHEEHGPAAATLELLGVSLEAARAAVDEMVGRGEQSPSGHLPFTPRAKRALELSLREAIQLGHSAVGTEHILLGILCEDDGAGAQVLATLAGDLALVREAVLAQLPGTDAQRPASSTSDAVTDVAEDPVEQAARTPAAAILALPEAQRPKAMRRMNRLVAFAKRRRKS